MPSGAWTSRVRVAPLNSGSHPMTRTASLPAAAIQAWAKSFYATHGGGQRIDSMLAARIEIQNDLYALARDAGIAVFARKQDMSPNFVRDVLADKHPGVQFWVDGEGWVDHRDVMLDGVMHAGAEHLAERARISVDRVHEVINGADGVAAPLELALLVRGSVKLRSSRDS